MKKTQTNAIKVIKANIKNLQSLHDMEAEQGNQEWATKYLREIMGLEFALNCLTDKDYLNAMANALHVQEGK